MSRSYEPLDPRGAKTYPLASRPSKVQVADAARPWQAGGSLRAFLDTLPSQLAARDFRAIVTAILAAGRRGRPVILGMGAHAIKVGLSPVIVDLLERRLVTALALNGAGVVHDVELAVAGVTSEDVEARLAAGEVGMAEETGRIINEAVAAGVARGLGFGRAVGERLLALRPAHLAQSLVAACARLDRPCTVHVAIGTDIVHMHPSCQGGATGEASLRDFRLLAAVVADLNDGGVYLNLGSAVVLPEVFLKALTLARNLGHRVQDFVTVNLDFVQHYRPTQNVVRRPVAQGGNGYALTGHHELLVPLLAAALIEGAEASSG
ncbi:MAG TPA: hypothetical protein VMG58_10120 [Candidatus Sulfotelmatobacter sp.]|nr:hypothetical protein [Candidatus Sulfotelmatobacter sp.]